MMEPLLLEECCAQIMRGVEEGEVMTPHPTVVANSEHVRAARRKGERAAWGQQGEGGGQQGEGGGQWGQQGGREERDQGWDCAGERGEKMGDVLGREGRRGGNTWWGGLGSRHVGSPES